MTTERTISRGMRPTWMKVREAAQQIVDKASEAGQSLRKPGYALVSRSSGA